MSTRLLIPALFLTLLAPIPRAQETPSATDVASSTPDLATLIEKVSAAHWPKPHKTELDRYKALLRFTPVREGQASTEFDLTVSYLAPGLLRYKVDEPGKTLEQGVDEQGVWNLIGKEVTKLQGKDHRKEIDEARGYVGLAGQLLRVLDPASVLTSLTEPSAPRAGTFSPTGKDRVDTFVVEGRLAAFPLQEPLPDGKRTAPVVLTVTVDARTWLLILVEARVLDPKGQPTGTIERVLLRDPVEQAGTVLPRELLLYRGGRLDSRVAIRSIELDPKELSVDAIRRPR